MNAPDSGTCFLSDSKCRLRRRLFTDTHRRSYSVRTDTWRCTLWMWWDAKNLRGDFSRAPAAVELYSHSGDGEADFDAFENANEAAANADVVAQMLARAKTQWGTS